MWRHVVLLMAMRRYTDEQRLEALRIGRSEGWSEASRQTGIPNPTIQSWARRAGVKTNVIAATAARVQANALTMEQRRLTLAGSMAERAQTILDSMDELLHRTMSAEVVTPGDVQKLAQAVGILIDKVQLLTGEATSREEHVGGYDLNAELRKHQAQQDELAQLRKRKDISV